MVAATFLTPEAVAPCARTARRLGRVATGSNRGKAFVSRDGCLCGQKLRGTSRRRFPMPLQSAPPAGGQRGEPESYPPLVDVDGISRSSTLRRATGSVMRGTAPAVAAIQRLAKRHLAEHTLVLYDLTSSYLEGTHCPLAQRGHSRDGKPGTLQILFGLLCTAEGCPVAVEVFEGLTGDPKTVASQVDKIRTRFGLQRVVLVGDRGMLTAAPAAQFSSSRSGGW